MEGVRHVIEGSILQLTKRQPQHQALGSDLMLPGKAVERAFLQ